MSHTTADSASERVYREVKELILTNAIAGGELISEGEVAQRCDVSRTPVREAFLRLQAEGWMRLYPKRGALVVPIGDREAIEVIDARLLIEEHAVRAVVADPVRRDALAEALGDNLAEHQRIDSGDIAEFSRLDAEFHQLIVGAGDNALLTGFFGGLGERHRRMTTVSVHRDAAVPAQIVDDHRALRAAVVDGDADRFAELLAHHLKSVHDLRTGATR